MRYNYSQDHFFMEITFLDAHQR